MRVTHDGCAHVSCGNPIVICTRVREPHVMCTHRSINDWERDDGAREDCDHDGQLFKSHIEKGASCERIQRVHAVINARDAYKIRAR